MGPDELERMVLGRVVLIDTNIIIYLTDSVEPYVALSRRLFEIIERGKAQGVVSMISVAEVMQGPLREGRKENAHRVRDFLFNFPNLVCQDVTHEVLEKIGEDKRVRWSRLRAADSVIIASGIQGRADRVVSNDRHFKAALEPGFILSFEALP